MTGIAAIHHSLRKVDSHPGNIHAVIYISQLIHRTAMHTHAHAKSHEHAHPVRTPAQAFGVGLVHGLAGSGGVAVLLVAAVSDRTLAVIALLVLVAGCVLSMTILSGLVGRVLGMTAARRRFTAAIPALASAACLFGLWYAAVALQSL